jgi:hypothetical protein
MLLSPACCSVTLLIVRLLGATNSNGYVAVIVSHCVALNDGTASQSGYC